MQHIDFQYGVERINFSQLPIVVKVLKVLSAVSVLGGFVMCVIFWPGDPGEGYSWKFAAYIPSSIGLSSGVTSAAIFYSLASVIMFLRQIEINTRKDKIFAASSFGVISDTSEGRVSSSELIEREKQIGKLQSKIATVEMELKTLEAEFYDDPERWALGSKRHSALNVRLEGLKAELEKLQQ